MFNTVLIANRGAIATRIIRTLKRLGVRSVAVYHSLDANSLHVQLADVAVDLGTGSVADTYLNAEKILAVAKAHGAQAIHPGYGFLSENTGFVTACEQQGIVFIGPTTDQMETFGLKHVARDTAAAADVPLVPGSPLLQSLEDAKAIAVDIGFPVMLKSTAGGGGIGMQVCKSLQELNAAWDSVKRLSANYFSNDGVFLEKYIANSRHIEVQVFGDGKGIVVSLGERDCSAQRRNQKVIEETPAPGLSDEQRRSLHETAERLMAAVSYRNAGTVEFIFDADTGEFYFLEVNTRLQVEHGVTEEVWGVDLVEWMLLQAAGEIDDLAALKSLHKASGHAIQVRIYAEDPLQDFLPSAGLLSRVEWPNSSVFEGSSDSVEASGLRIDSWVEAGTEVSSLFDPMIAKVIVHQADRSRALDALAVTLKNTNLYGIETNRRYLLAVLNSQQCREGKLLTGTLSQFVFNDKRIQILQAGTQTTIQDYPGRTGLWHVGVPPSGPMDDLSFRLANQLLGNDERAAALEITLNGPTLKFSVDCTVAITGAEIDITLDDVPVPAYRVVNVLSGQVLSLGKIKSGARAYLAVAGGIQCPEYLASKSTFTLGQFGGHSGRALRVGDVLTLAELIPQSMPIAMREDARPLIDDEWTLRVIYGPHGAPDFFTDDDIKTFFEADWRVHYNSSRTGVRLIGPKPTWARDTGGEAGLHPSNIHDNAYAFGTVDFTGDMPVILGPDGPSLGGFVCPATVIRADLWKLGQLKAGAKVRFVPVSYQDAVALEAEQLANIRCLRADSVTVCETIELTSPVIKTFNMGDESVAIRLAGDHFLLIELGPLELDIERRFKVHVLMLWLQENSLPGVRELTPGIRSLQVHYDSQQLPLEQLLTHIEQAISSIIHSDDLRLSSRIVHLPLSWNDKACQLAVEKYMQSVREDAPWCPSNLEFIRRINGLDSIEQVKEIVFDASYLVMGLGDVYLGAPVATPLDPRHRLVTTKYNPARTWTAENSVGIGGAYLCVYGMEGPGGYQFVGRTLQMWNRYHQTEVFENPWLLRFFDQIKFYPVSESELETIRHDFPLGKYPIQIEEVSFSLNDYKQFLLDHESQISDFQQHRQKAFDQELEHWRQTGQLTYQQDEGEVVSAADDVLADNEQGIFSSVSGSVWKLLVEEGDQVEQGQAVMILESMKMEVEVYAESPGKVVEILRKQGSAATAGQLLIKLTSES